MMRTSLVGSFIILVTTALPVQGQGSMASSVMDLRPPSTPAFVLLGVEPASVTAPTSPRALATWAFSSIGADGVIPQNVALEIAPFWLRSQPGFTFDHYFAHNVALSGIPHVVYRTVVSSLSLSAASAPAMVEQDTVGTAIAFGLRTLLWPGRAPEGLSQQKDSLVVRLGRCSALDDPGPCFAQTQALRDSIRAGIREPVGFVVQVSGGASLQSSEAASSATDWRRWGIWVSPTYRTARNLDFIGVGRYQRDYGTASDPDVDLFDAGIRLLWRPGDRIAISAEGLHRWMRGTDGAEDASPRWGGLVEFRAREDLYVFYAFGRDFAAANVSGSPLFARLGLSLGMGQKPSVVVP